MDRHSDQYSVKHQELPSVTVVIPTLNEEQYLARTLAQLADQTYPRDRLEILIIDGDSQDRTRSEAEAFIATTDLSVKLLNNPLRTASPARNIGIRNAKSSFVLFIDAHVHIPSDQVILKMATAAMEKNARVLGRAQPLHAPGITAIQESIAAVRASPLGHSRESYIYSDCGGWVSPLSVGVMYRLDLFEQYGLFDESFDAAEDAEFNYRLEKAGIQALIDPEFTVFYYPRRNFVALFKQMQRYGTGRINLYRKHPERLRLETFMPLVSSLLLLVLVATSVFIEPSRTVGLSALFMMVIGVIGSVWPYRQSAKPATVALSPIALATIHLGLAWGVVKGFCGSEKCQLVRCHTTQQETAVSLLAISHRKS